MYKILFFMSMFLGASVWAGTHGGGVVSSLPQAGRDQGKPQSVYDDYVRYVGRDHADIVYQQKRMGQDIEVIKKRPEEFGESDVDVLSALKRSEESLDWAEISRRK